MHAHLVAAFAWVYVISFTDVGLSSGHVPCRSCLQGSGSQLATCNLELVRPRPGLHPGDLTLKPDATALELERQRMAEAAHNASSDLGASPTDSQNNTAGETCRVQQASSLHMLHALLEYIL